MEEKPTKRRVLSLSLSQQGRERRKLFSRKRSDPKENVSVNSTQSQPKRALRSQGWKSACDVDEDNFEVRTESNLSEDLDVETISDEGNEVSHKQYASDLRLDPSCKTNKHLNHEKNRGLEDGCLSSLNRPDKQKASPESYKVCTSFSTHTATVQLGTESTITEKSSSPKENCFMEDKEQQMLKCQAFDPCLSAAGKKDKGSPDNSSVITGSTLLFSANHDEERETLNSVVGHSYSVSENSLSCNQKKSPEQGSKENKYSTSPERAPIEEQIKRGVDLSKLRTHSEPDNNELLPHAPGSSCNEEEILQCPVCGKSFESQTTKASHMKSCAAKHGVTTRQLLDALELQQRQAAERKALGLPALPTIANVKKTVAAKKPTRSNAQSKIDNGLQLALALSLSLQNQKEHQTVGSKDEESALSLENYGFVSKPSLASSKPRPAVTGTSTKGNRGKTVNKKTLPLLTRTDEERQRIVTEKVAMVLMDEVDTTQKDSFHTVSLESEILREYHNKENLLWKKSSVSPSQAARASFYVDSLRGVVTPSKVKVGSKVQHLSQVPGRLPTPTKALQEDDKESVISLTPSNEGSSSDPGSPREGQTTKTKHDSPLSSSHLEMELRAKLFNDWAEMVNNATMSDLTIYPCDGRDIPAHKVLFMVRCPEVLRDIVRQRNSLTGHEVEVVLWSKVPHAAALAFLEYVYCGSVKSIPALSDDLSSIQWLANHYKVSDLQRYLRVARRQSFGGVSSSQAALVAVSNSVSASSSKTVTKDKSSIVQKDVVTPKNHQKADHLRRKVIPDGKDKLSSPKSHRESRDMFVSPPRTPPRSDSDSIYSQQTVASRHGSREPSPDLFGEDAALDMEDAMPEENREDVDCLVSLIDNMSQSASHSKSIQNVTRCSSSSDVTVIAGEDARPSPGTMLADSISPELLKSQPSPALSQASVATELLQPAPDVLSDASESSINDSKRKHSNASCENELSLSKRKCTESIPGTSSRNDCSAKSGSSSESESVELMDLTQDSDSGAGFPEVGRFSDGSGNKIVISSESESSMTTDVNEKLNVSLNQSDEAVGVVSTTAWRKAALDDALLSQGEEEGNAHEFITKQPNESGENVLQENRLLDANISLGVNEPYISPVWDGFEEIHFDEPLGFPFSPSPKKSQNNNSPTKSSTSEDAPSGVAHTAPQPQKIQSSCFKSPCEVSDSSKTRKKTANVKLGIQQHEESDDSDSSSNEITSYQKSHSNTKNADVSVGALLDDSLNAILNDSILKRVESCAPEVSKPLTQRETKGTPVNRILSTHDLDVTPLANYSAMKTPQLKKELQKFGLKPSLGKRKGKLMLRHIYNELHPWVPIENQRSGVHISLSQPSSSNIQKSDRMSCSQQPVSSTESKKRLDTSDGETSDNEVSPIFEDRQDADMCSDSSSSSSGKGNLEGSILEDYENDFEPLSQGPTQKNKVDLPTTVQKYITSDPSLHQKVLEYEPIWIEQLHEDLKTQGFKFKMADLMAFLDEKCITFRTNQSGPRTKKKQIGKPKKAKESNARISDSE